LGTPPRAVEIHGDGAGGAARWFTAVKKCGAGVGCSGVRNDGASERMMVKISSSDGG
jgi:hypothetical protein